MCHLLVGVDFYFSTIFFIVLIIIIIWNCTFFGYFSPEMNAVQWSMSECSSYKVYVDICSDLIKEVS